MGSDTGGHAQAAAPAPPKSFEWYLEGVKWLLVIAAGAVAFGVASLEKTPWWPAYVAFGLFAAPLAVASFFGVHYLFNSYMYAGLREANTSPDDLEVVTYKGRADQCFRLTTWGFAIGMVLFAAFGGLYVYDTWVRQDHHLEIVALATDGPELAVVRRGERTWLLVRHPDGSTGWRPMKTPR
jgi:hypothetical protein